MTVRTSAYSKTKPRSLLDRIFGRKSISYEGFTPSSIAGYPSWWAWSDSYGFLYRSQPAVRTVVDFISTNFAQLNLKIYDRKSDMDRIEWADHPVALLLRRPNPQTTRSAFFRATEADRLIYDRAYWRKVRTGGRTDALVRIPPSRLEVEFHYDTLETTYRFKGETISRRDLVIFSGYHPDGSEQGVSPLETLRRVLAEEWASSTAREAYWRNGPKIPGWAERPIEAPEWEPKARDVFMADLVDMTTGNNAGKPVLFEDGIKWKTGEVFSAQDSQYLEARQFTYEEVARVYAPSLVGLLKAGSSGAVESFHRQLYQDVLAPRCDTFQDEVDLQLLGLEEFDQGGNPYSEFNLGDKLKGSFEEQASVLATTVGVPVAAVNEGRSRLNLPRIDEEWADVPVRPLNVMYGGQASTQIPTADPSTPTGLRAYLDRQERSFIASLKANGYVPGNIDRWDRELEPVFGAGAELFNAELVDRVVEAYNRGGVDEVAKIYEEARSEIR